MVRYSVLVRRPGDRGDDRRGMAGDGAQSRCPMVELSRVLAAEHVRGLVWGGVDPVPAALFCAFHAGDVADAALLDAAPGRRLRTYAFCAQPLPQYQQLSSLLFPLVDGDGWVLGDTLAQYP